MDAIRRGLAGSSEIRRIYGERRSNGDIDMMTAQNILNLLTAEPFEPFHIHTASGRVFDVRHPEFAQVGRNSLTIFAPPPEDPDGPQRWEKLSLMLIESVAPIDSGQHSDDAT